MTHPVHLIKYKHPLALSLSRPLLAVGTLCVLSWPLLASCREYPSSAVLFGVSTFPIFRSSLHLSRDDLIKPVSKSVRPSVRPYVRPSVHNQTEWRQITNSGMDRGRWDMHDDITLKLVQGRGQRHEAVKVAKIVDFKSYLLPHLSREIKCY